MALGLEEQVVHFTVGILLRAKNRTFLWSCPS